MIDAGIPKPAQVKTPPETLSSRWRRLTAKDGFWAFWLILPSALGIAVFNGIPVLGSLWLSLTKWNFLGSPRFVGLKNYSDLFADSLFYQVMGQTFSFVGLVVGLEVVLGLLLALALAHAAKGAGLLRAAYFLPFVSSLVAVSVVWSWLFDPRYGALNAILGMFGVSPVHWLADPAWALPAIALVTVWKNLGYTMVLFLAGLQAIPPTYQEAAAVDGANALQRFWRITLPLLSPTTFMVAVLSIIGSFQVFDTVYMMTQGGPENTTMTVVYWLYKNAFVYYNLGKASAIAYVLFALILALTLVQWGVRKKWVYAE